MQANVFVRRGFAVLLYDKRGAGESEGDHESATYAQLVDDALAAVSFLKRHESVDSSQLGLLGISESGWLTPEIAERSGGLGFVVNKSGPCFNWQETNAWEVYNELLKGGASPEVATEQVVVWRRLWQFRSAPEDTAREELERSLATWAGREGSLLPAQLREVSEAYRRDISYDPTPFISRSTTPMLYVYGETDVNVPAGACTEHLSRLQGEGAPVSVHVFSGEGHELGGLTARGYRLTGGYDTLVGDFAVARVR